VSETDESRENAKFRRGGLGAGERRREAGDSGPLVEDSVEEARLEHAHTPSKANAPLQGRGMAEPRIPTTFSKAFHWPEGTACRSSSEEARRRNVRLTSARLRHNHFTLGAGVRKGS
jgi:hypothetical protein